MIKPISAPRRGAARWSVPVGIVLAAAACVAVLLWREADNRNLSRLRALLTRDSALRRMPSLWLRRASRELELDLRRSSDLRSMAVAAQRKSKQPLLVGAFYDPELPSGIQSCQANAGVLTHVFPHWLSLTADGALDYSRWDPVLHRQNQSLAWTAWQNGVKIIPVLDNRSGGRPRIEAVKHLFASPEAQREMARTIRAWLLREGFQGINVDFSGLPKDIRDLYPRFLQILRTELLPAGLALDATLSPQRFTPEIAAAADACDLLVIRSHTEDPAQNAVRTASPLAQFQELLGSLRAELPAEKLVPALGSLAFEWHPGEDRSRKESYVSLMAKLRSSLGDPEGPLPGAPLSAESPYFYQSAGGPRAAWLMDGISFYNRLLEVSEAGMRGVALLRLGDEDPSVWPLLAEGRPDPIRAAESLEYVELADQIRFSGRGELLTVQSAPVEGRRLILGQDRRGHIIGSRYQSFPAPFVVERRGFMPGAIALSFDDGPDPQYTPQILDILRLGGVRATFFVVGQHVVLYPELVQRIYAEGHEIGSHTFTHPNMADLSERRREMELDLTQRALEAALHRGTRLYRTPYSSDFQPASGRDILPLITASRLNYISVGGAIDPQDWNLGQTKENGWQIQRGFQDITAQVLRLAATGRGSMVVLHDGGGNRSQTVAALPGMIEELKAAGYAFVTASALIGLSRDEVMPAHAGGSELTPISWRRAGRRQADAQERRRS